MTRNRSAECKTTIDVSDDLQDVEISARAQYVDNGIGAYEFWGQKCNHSDYRWEIDEVQWDMEKYTDTQNAEIETYINKNHGKVSGDLFRGMDIPEPDYEPETREDDD